MVTVVGVRVAYTTATKERQAAEDRVTQQKTNDDDRSKAATAAAKEDADRQIAALKETAAAELAAAHAQLDASHRPLLSDVYPYGPLYPDMGARPNPAAEPARHGAAQTISLNFRRFEVDWDPRKVFVKLDGGMAFISVPLRNVGRGLAVINAAAITIEGVGLGDFKQAPAASRPRVPREKRPVST